jgi:ferredoxin
LATKIGQFPSSKNLTEHLNYLSVSIAGRLLRTTMVLKPVVISAFLFSFASTLISPSSSFKFYTKSLRVTNKFIFMDVLPYKQRRHQNVKGNLYIDESCIDCDVCRWMCPNVYSRKGIKSIVHMQPSDDLSKYRAYAAMVACPVGAIRTTEPDPLAKLAVNAFPAEVIKLPLWIAQLLYLNSSNTFIDRS